jgi:taurine dioxygenase
MGANFGPITCRLRNKVREKAGHGAARREFAALSSLRIRPLTVAIGAVLTGLDLRRPLSPAQQADIRAALRQYLVIFVPGQDIELADQVRFSGYFGELVMAKGQRVTDDVPGINMLDQVAPVGQGADDWHSDHMFLPEPPMATTLRSVIVPDVGGDTCFASMYAAYDALSPRVQHLLDGLSAYNSAAPVVARVKDKGIYANDIERDMHPPVVHPCVRIHPETGRKALFVCGNYTTRIVELSERESHGLLDLLFDHIKSPHFHCRYRWEPNTLALWDNRAVQHCAIPDYQERRVMYRTMIAGTRPFGPQPAV